MSDQEQDRIVQTMLTQAKQQARDGTEILKELAPELPWQKADNLAGQRILIMDVEPGYSQFKDDALRITLALEDDTVWRLTSIYDVVNRKLKKLESQLPLWVNWVKRSTAHGTTYYDIE